MRLCFTEHAKEQSNNFEDFPFLLYFYGQMR